VNTAASFVQSFADGQAAGGKSHGFDKRFDGGGGIGVAEEDAVDTGREDLLDHPGIHAHGDFVSAIGGESDDDGGGAMAALVGPPLTRPRMNSASALTLKGACSIS
jgi:hypothetical protein